MRRLLIFLFSFLLINGSIAQMVTVQIKNAQTYNPIAFTKISDGGHVIIADIDGKAKINIHPQTTYIFHFFDFKEQKIKGSELLKDSMILLYPKTNIHSFNEVVILPGANPAHRIIKNVMDNQKKNDPLRNDPFEYDSYSKFYATGEIPDSIRADTIKDSSTINALAFLKDKYIFLIETGAHRTFNPPRYDKTEINSYNVSGVKAPMFATLLNQFQSFSFYNNSFELGGTNYINPIAPGAFNRYWFILEDTIFHKKNPLDTTYIISYRPQKGANFKSLKGYLYINTNGWAIQRVIASPYSNKDSQGFEVTITQEYKITNSKKWFPEKISTEIKVNAVSFGPYLSMIARGSVYIRDVKFYTDENRNGFNPVKVKVDPNALSDSTELARLRGNTATGKEANTYHVIDSIAKENNFQQTYKLLMILSTGKIPIGKISLPLKRIANYNNQEGIRLGLGLETNDRLSELIKVGGYFAYGFHDKEWKWGGDLQLTFNRERLLRLKLHYSDDLHERGGTDFYKNESSLFSKRTYSNLFINRLDRERYAGINFGGLIRQNMQLQVFGNYKRFFFIDDYQFLPLMSANGAINKFDIAEVGIAFNWNIYENVILLGNRRVSLGTKWPRIGIKAVRGIKGILNSQYDYYRLNMQIEQNFNLRGFGKISLLSTSGMTLGNVPLTLMQVSKGTSTFGKGNFTISAPYTFQTMHPAEFFSDKFTALFLKLQFLPIKNKTSWTEPLFSIHSSVGVGSMANITDHKNFDFKTLEKGYYESGLVIDNLIKFGVIGFGFGAFYRYGPYAYAHVADNLFYKLSIHINLNLFGSN